MKYQRLIDLNPILKRKSIFLFGPRQTGKSTLLTERYPQALVIDLLNRSTYQQYARNLGYFVDNVRYAVENQNQKLIIVDEVQKLPELLDEVHSLIESYKDLRFILTGSSARKLKREGANLLGGRASWLHLHPLVSKEIGFDRYQHDLRRISNYGTLPSILNSEDPWEDLKDYIGLYLKEEIKHEALVRSLEGFTRFFNHVALTNSEQVNFTRLGDDAQVSPRKVREYYQVLEDTLVGYLLPAFYKTKKRKAMTTAKFFFFDTGITNCLLEQKELSTKTSEFGKILEQMIFNELKAYLDYYRIEDALFYWRSTSKLEVDFLVKTAKEKWIAIEVKSSTNPSSKSYRGIFALEEEIPLEKKIVVCLADSPRKTKEGIEILPLSLFLQQLWSDTLLT